MQQFGHGYFTSISFWIPCSAPPKARAKRDLRQIVGIQRGDQTVIGARDRLLRLHDFDVVGHAGREPVARLRERLIGQVEIVLRHRHLVGRRADVQKRRADLVIDLAGEIGQLVLALFQRGLGLDHVPGDAPAVKHVDLRRSHKRKCAVRIAERRPDVAIIGSDARRWDSARRAPP